MTTLTSGRPTATRIPLTLPGHQAKQLSGSADTTTDAPATMLMKVDRGVGAAARRMRRFSGSARSPLAGGRRRVRHPRTAATFVVALIAAAGLASSSAAAATPPACPDTVIPNVAIIPNAVGCWNAIAVQTIRLAAPYNVQGLIYMGYTQAAVYDAVTKIDGRYDPYHDFHSPAGVDVASASPDAAAAAAAYTMLTSSFLAFPATAQAGLSTKYSDYINALGGAGMPGRRRRDQDRSGRGKRPDRRRGRGTETSRSRSRPAR